MSDVNHAENLKNQPNVDIGALKRKMKKQAGAVSKMLKTSGGRGERIEAVVIKRLPAKPSNGSGKPPPTKLIIMVVSPTVNLDIINKIGEDDYGPTASRIEQGSVHWYGAFELSNNVTEGCRIVLVNPRGDIYKERLSLGGGAELVEKASVKVLTGLDPVCYKLPTLENMGSRGNVILPVNVKALAPAFQAFTWGMEDPNTYLYKDRNDPDLVKMGAYVAENKGYPFTVVTSEGNVLLNVRMYENHLVNFGVMDIEMWVKFAPVLLEGMVGCIIGYVNVDQSRGLDMNHGKALEGCDYNYGLSINSTILTLDMRATIESVGFPVSVAYVNKHFRDEQFLESDHSVNNVVNKQRDSMGVVNLSEFTGKITKFTGEPGWKFWTLVNPSNFDDITHPDLDTLRKAGEVDELSTALEFEGQYIWAIRS